MTPAIVRALPIVALVHLTACGTGPVEPPPPTDGVEIRLTSGLRFIPANVTIDAGTTVRWVNAAALFHTVTPSNDDQAGVWLRTPTTAAGPALSHTFSEPGQTYSYFCEPHVGAGMVGTITVRP